MKIVQTTSLVIFVILRFCNPVFPCNCNCRDLDVIQQVALDKEEVERAERNPSVSAELPVLLVGKNQMAGWVPRVAAVLVEP